MKCKHIATVLIALSLIATTFIATAAGGYVYYATMSGYKAGKNFTLTIDATSASTIGPDPPSTITNFGTYVDTGTIKVTIFNTKGVAIEIYPDWTRIAVKPDGSSIVIQLVKQDGLPSHALAINAVGDLTGPYAGHTIFASGPGWGWGGHY